MLFSISSIWENWGWQGGTRLNKSALINYEKRVITFFQMYLGIVRIN